MHTHNHKHTGSLMHPSIHSCQSMGPSAAVMRTPRKVTEDRGPDHSSEILPSLLPLPWPPAHPVLGGQEGAQLGNPIPGGFHKPMQSQQTNDIGWGRGDPGVGGLSARATEAKGPSPGPMLGADESPYPWALALTDRRPGSGNLPRRCCHGGALWEQERP